MTTKLTILTLFVALLISTAPAQKENPSAFLGFDRNEYPGDESLPVLRKTFSYASYWLNSQPGSKNNSWLGKRETLQKAGFGFLVVVNGKLYAQLKSLPSAASAGKDDGNTASEAARKEGFPQGTAIFLDQEEGGRLLDLQRSYIHAFADAVTRTGFRVGVYCSGIPFKESNGTIVDTAHDLQNNSGERRFMYWVANDACPPSPGCSTTNVPRPSDSGIAFAEVWQYAQSPRRPNYTSTCAKTYAADKNCYAPATHIHVDFNTANSPDPSHGRE